MANSLKLLPLRILRRQCSSSPRNKKLTTVRNLSSMNVLSLTLKDPESLRKTYSEPNPATKQTYTVKTRKQ